MYDNWPLQWCPSPRKNKSCNGRWNRIENVKQSAKPSRWPLPVISRVITLLVGDTWLYLQLGLGPIWTIPLPHSTILNFVLVIGLPFFHVFSSFHLVSIEASRPSLRAITGLPQQSSTSINSSSSPLQELPSGVFFGDFHCWTSGQNSRLIKKGIIEGPWWLITSWYGRRQKNNVGENCTPTLNTT